MIIDGRKIADKILSGIKTEILSLPFRPIFCDILVGDDAVSRSYVNIKGKKAMGVGMDFLPMFFSEDVSQEKLVAEIQKLNQIPELCGLVVQLPLPERYDERVVLDAVAQDLDVDCMGRENQLIFYSKQPGLALPTAGAIFEIFKELKITEDKLVAVVGKGDLVGKPTAHLLAQKGYRVATADRKTQDLKAFCLQADVVISATGIPGLITGDMIKPGSIVIDAGTSESGGSIVGDVERLSVSKVAGFLTPVPGGVGPVTVAVLLSNVLNNAKQKLKSDSWKLSA
jgi:methylenetetrahydrofolate dehydrogenase (NADP+)/methenyltetrahydrofolate cyclohydrolase